MTSAAALTSGGAVETTYSVAALVDIDDFVALTCANGERWGARAVDRTDALIHNAVVGHCVRSVRHTPPDEWVVDVVGHEYDAVTDKAAALAESIMRAAHDGSGAPVTVTVTLSDVHRGVNSAALAEADARRLAGFKLVTGGDRVIRGSQSPEPAQRSVPSKRVSSELSRLVDLNDREGVHQLLVAWIERCALEAATTPDVLREWLVGELLFVFSKLARGRMPDGSVDWLATGSSAALSRILEVAEIHERSYLRIWLDRTLAEAFGDGRDQAPVNPLLISAEQYIARHLDDPALGLDRVARAVSMSPFYLAHLFRSERDTTFRRHLAACRVDLARRLLQNPELSIEEIAQRTGYASVKQFRSVFRRERGCTPSAYRCHA